MQIGEEYSIRYVPSVLALDGEREVEVHQGQEAAIRLGIAGPTVVNVTRTMNAAMNRDIFASNLL
jgi:hypothetical protein